MSYIAYHEQKQAETPKPKTYTLEELAELICGNYDECSEDCPGFAYCRHDHKGVLVWLRSAVERSGNNGK